MSAPYDSSACNYFFVKTVLAFLLLFTFSETVLKTVDLPLEAATSIKELAKDCLLDLTPSVF